MRLAIVGSQSFGMDVKAMQQAERLVCAYIGRHMPDVLISGGCPRGVDYMAENIGYDYGYIEEDGTLIIHRPKVMRWSGADGFAARNWKIADDCTHLVAIRHRYATTYGSGWTADRAEELGKTVWREFVG